MLHFVINYVLSTVIHPGLQESCMATLSLDSWCLTLAVNGEPYTFNLALKHLFTIPSRTSQMASGEREESLYWSRRSSIVIFVSCKKLRSKVWQLSLLSCRFQMQEADRIVRYMSYLQCPRRARAASLLSLQMFRHDSLHSSRLVGHTTSYVDRPHLH
jgi:hypothetical protein